MLQENSKEMAEAPYLLIGLLNWWFAKLISKFNFKNYGYEIKRNIDAVL